MKEFNLENTLITGSHLSIMAYVENLQFSLQLFSYVAKSFSKKLALLMLFPPKSPKYLSPSKVGQGRV
jgi:hypothetical protein